MRLNASVNGEIIVQESYLRDVCLFTGCAFVRRRLTCSWCLSKVVKAECEKNDVCGGSKPWAPRRLSMLQNCPHPSLLRRKGISNDALHWD